MLNTKHEKLNVIVSHIGLTTLRLTNKEFKEVMDNNCQALLSKAKNEVKAYKIGYKDYRRLKKIVEKLPKMRTKLKRTRKLVKGVQMGTFYVKPIKLQLTKNSWLFRRSRFGKTLLNVCTMVDMMLLYMKQFQAYVKGIAKKLYKPTYRKSVFIPFAALSLDSNEDKEVLKSGPKISNESDLKTLIALSAIPNSGGDTGYLSGHTLVFDDAMDQKTAVTLVQLALDSGYPAHQLIFPESLGVRIGENGKVKKY